MDLIMDCIFCKITSGQVPSEIVHEEPGIKVIKDIHPKAPVHLLVIPAKHIESIARLKENHAEDISRMIYAAKRAAASLGLAGYKLVFNVGREGGQMVDHLHLHLLGGWKSQDERKVDV